MSTIKENKQFWEQELEKLKSSGLSRAQYCRENDINYERFSYWIKKLNPEVPTFIPVKIQTTEPMSHHVALCALEIKGHLLKIYDLSALSYLLERLS